MDIQLPPARYDHYPTVIFGEIHKPKKEVEKFCSEIGAGYKTMACTWIIDGKIFTVVLPMESDYNKCDYDHIVRHEYGHVNGWPVHHPDFENGSCP